MDTTSQEILNNLLLYEYVPCGITRPLSDNAEVGSCIGNRFVKSSLPGIIFFKVQ